MEKPVLQEETYYLLQQIQKWSKNLAIAGFILLGLGVLFFLLFFAGMSAMTQAFEDQPQTMSSYPDVFPAAFKVLMVIVYLAAFLISLFPLIYLYRFSSHLKRSLSNGDGMELHVSFDYLKKHFKFLAVLMFIALALYGLSMVFALIGMWIGNMFMG